MLASFFIFAAATVAGLSLTPLVIRFACKWGLYDTPQGDRRVHTEPLPRLGGVGIFLAVGVAVFAMGLASLYGGRLIVGPPSFFFGVLFGGGIIFATGLLDDVRGLRPLTKISAQLVAAAVVYGYGFRIEQLSLGPNLELPLGMLALPLTIFWVVGVTNAFNLIDGLDGLASGIAVVALGATLIVAMALGNWDTIPLTVAVLGAVLGFFRYNRSPAKIFLGDSGSLFVGFMLAVLTVQGSVRADSSVLILVPFFALAIPLLDTSLAILRRWLRGVPLSQADGRHIHHRLLAVGLSHRHSVIVLHVAAAALAAVGLSLVLAPPPAVISIAAAGGGATLFLLLFGLKQLQYHEFTEAGSVLTSGIGRVRRIIRDQIWSRDVAAVLRQSEGIDQLNAILEDNASSFSFLHMEVCRESATRPRPLVLFNGHVARAWKLDFPVTSHDFVDGDDYVLRIWCNPQMEAGPYGAERIAQILAPVIEERMNEPGFRSAPVIRGLTTVTPIEREKVEIGEREISLEQRVHAVPRAGAGIRPSA